MINLSIVQFAPLFGNPAHNLERISSLVAGLQTDIIVLPELCTTGYSFITREEVTNAAEYPGEGGVAKLQALAMSSGAMVIAGFAEKVTGGVYNSALIALPNGDYHVYRKTHLFFREKVCFDEGNSGFFVVEHPFKDCRVGVMVCNDWRYPEAARSLALLGADVICCPCNLVSNVWQVGMAARALENKVYLAVANRYGTERRTLPDGSEQVLLFNGGSVVFDVMGSAMASAGAAEDAVISVTIDAVTTRDKRFNEFNDLLADRRPGYYVR